MDGMPQGAMDGGVAMVMDGRSYITSSHGRKKDRVADAVKLCREVTMLAYHHGI
jgi:hypothetical protein